MGNAYIFIHLYLEGNFNAGLFKTVSSFLGWGFGRPKLVLDRKDGFYHPKLSESVRNCPKLSN